MFHHRRPTSTPNTEQQAHPFIISGNWTDYEWHIIHNGIIYNCDELFKIHTEEGIKYRSYVETSNTYMKRSFNDSEALAIDLVKTLEGMPTEQGVLQARGPMAWIATKIRKDNKKVLSVHWGRNGNPLLSDTESYPGFLILASEGRGKDVTPNEIHGIDLVTKKLLKPVPLLMHSSMTSEKATTVKHSGKIDWEKDDDMRFAPPSREEVGTSEYYEAMMGFDLPPTNEAKSSLMLPTTQVKTEPPKGDIRAIMQSTQKTTLDEQLEKANKGTGPMPYFQNHPAATTFGDTTSQDCINNCLEILSNFAEHLSDEVAIMEGDTETVIEEAIDKMRSCLRKAVVEKTDIVLEKAYEKDDKRSWQQKEADKIKNETNEEIENLMNWNKAKRD